MNTTEFQASAPKPHVAGYLLATCSKNERGSSYLSKKEFKTPVHISKPYWDGNSLLLNLMCPTAGLLADDSVRLDINVEEKASLTLSNPSSLRIHKMEQGCEATWTQSFQVARNAFLENNPEWLILQGKSSLTQRTDISVAEGGELFFIESQVPGRIAHGEAFQFSRFRNRLRLNYGERLAFLEKHNVQPSRDSHTAWDSVLGEKAPFYSSIILVSEKLQPSGEFWKFIYDLQVPGLKIGSSKLAYGPCWNVKLIASDPVKSRHALNAVRERFYQEIERRPVALRR